MAVHHDAAEERFGGYLESYCEGDTFRHWPGHTVTEAENHLFCLLTLSASPIHTDREYAKADLPEGRNLVVGTYVYALLLGMSVPDISGRAVANLGVRELRHLAPVHAGDTLYAESAVLETRPSASRPGEGLLTVRTTGRNQNGAVVCVFERSILLPLRPAGEAADV